MVRQFAGSKLNTEQAREAFRGAYTDLVFKTIFSLTGSRETADQLSERFFSDMEARFSEQPLPFGLDAYILSQVNLMCAQRGGRVTPAPPAQAAAAKHRVGLRRSKRVAATEPETDAQEVLLEHPAQTNDKRSVLQPLPMLRPLAKAFQGAVSQPVPKPVMAVPAPQPVSKPVMSAPAPQPVPKPVMVAPAPQPVPKSVIAAPAPQPVYGPSTIVVQPVPIVISTSPQTVVYAAQPGGAPQAMIPQSMLFPQYPGYPQPQEQAATAASQPPQEVYDPAKTELWLPEQEPEAAKPDAEQPKAAPPVRQPEPAPSTPSAAPKPDTPDEEEWEEANQRSIPLTIVNTFLFLGALGAVAYLLMELKILPSLF